MLGLGDVIFPGVLIVSAQVYAGGFAVLGIALPALGALLGAVLGMLLLALPMRRNISPDQLSDTQNRNLHLQSYNHW